MSAARKVDSSVAETIRAQIGSRAFMMLGAHSLTTDSRGRTLRFGIKGSRRVNTVVVTLEADDTYTMEFWKITPRMASMVACVAQVYVDCLRPMIETHTGLYTSI